MRELSTCDLAKRLLRWYGRHGRDLPWRVPLGATRRADPYCVWLSEIMLQQTTVAAVGSYYAKFVARWPTVQALAAASLDEVLSAWAGLGYYARARNLHACARMVSEELAGRFPDTEAALLRLAGVGPDTAAAIAAIAFGRRATVVDGNVERVMARLHAVRDPLPGAKVQLRALAATVTPHRRAGDYAQAVMDLGATVCTPRGPNCSVCPWRTDCRAHELGLVEELPARAPKRPRPTRRGVAFWAVRPDGAVLLRKRPARGLLGGMMEVPSTEWDENGAADPQDEAPMAADWQALPGVVRHTFTHFHLELAVMAAPVSGAADAHGVWVAPRDFGDHALPSLMRKIACHALDGGADAARRSK